MVVEGKVDEAREEVDKVEEVDSQVDEVNKVHKVDEVDSQMDEVDKVDKVEEAGEEEKERRVIIEIIQDANDILIAEESEEEDFKCEDCGDSENADP